MTVENLLNYNIKDVSDISPVYMYTKVFRFDINNQDYSYFLCRDFSANYSNLGKYFSLIDKTTLNRLALPFNRISFKTKLEHL